MGKFNKQEERKKMHHNHEKIIVNLELKSRENLNRWVKLQQILEVKEKCSEELFNQFQKILTDLRVLQNKENREKYRDTIEFLEGYSQKLPENDINFLKKFPKIKVVTIGPNQFKLLEQLEKGEQLKYLTGKKIILKNERQHVHIVKICDQDKQVVEVAAGATEGTDLSDKKQMLFGLLSGNEQGLKLFDWIVNQWG